MHAAYVNHVAGLSNGVALVPKPVVDLEVRVPTRGAVLSGGGVTLAGAASGPDRVGGQSTLRPHPPSKQK